MENKGGRKTKGKKGESKEWAASSGREGESSSRNATHKMDADSSKRAKGNSRRVSSGKKGFDKAEPMEVDSVAGPSGQTSPGNKIVVKKHDFMVECRYKFSPKKDMPPRRPYEVRWGEPFLNTLLPKITQEKSILKKSTSEKPKTKPRLKFSQTTVYYFERAQLTDIPTEGDIYLSMERHHFYSSMLPLDEYEDQKEVRQKRNLAATVEQEKDDENAMLVVEAKKNEDVSLHTIHVPVELLEEDKKPNVSKRVKKGCNCNVYCDPDMCECNLNGEQCEVYQDDFPCGCQLVFCRNSNGRKAYNNRYVKKNIISVTNSPPAPKEKKIKAGRVSKRKQVAPMRHRNN